MKQENITLAWKSCLRTKRSSLVVGSVNDDRKFFKTLTPDHQSHHGYFHLSYIHVIDSMYGRAALDRN
jgi:hypothetical protein